MIRLDPFFTLLNGTDLENISSISEATFKNNQKGSGSYLVRLSTSFLEPTFKNLSSFIPHSLMKNFQSNNISYLKY